MRKEVDIKDHILSIIWTYFLLFPTGNIFNISIPIILLLFYDTKSGGVKREIIPMLILLILTVVVNVGEVYMGFKPYVRLVTMAVVFITFASVKGSRILFPYILFATAFIVVSQICFFYNISFLTTFFNSFYDLTEKGIDLYGITDRSLNVESVTAGNTRLGGIFYNPNNCASYICVIYAMGLCEIDRLNKRIWPVLFVALIIVSLIVTGSRTSFIVFGLMSLYYLRVNGRSVKKYWPIGILAIVLFFVYSSSFDDLRMFKVGEGMNDSFGVKMRYFGSYLSAADNPIQLLFGAGDQMVTVVKYHSPLPGTDCDLGDIFITFGLFFYIAYIAFYFQLYKKYTPLHRVILIVLLWSFSNSLLASYRMCPVWFLSLGVLYRQSLIIKAMERQQRINQKQIQQEQ